MASKSSSKERRSDKKGDKKASKRIDYLIEEKSGATNQPLQQVNATPATVRLDVEHPADATSVGDASLDGSSDILADSSVDDSESYYTPGKHLSDRNSVASGKTLDEYRSFASADEENQQPPHDDTLRDVSHFDTSSDNTSFCTDTNGNSDPTVPLVPYDSSTPVPSPPPPLIPKEQPATNRVVSSSRGIHVVNTSSGGGHRSKLEDTADMDSSVSTESEITEIEEEEGLETDLEDNAENDDEVYGVVFTRSMRDPNPVLPTTVTKLETPDGGKVYLVGTAHFSLESQDDVAKTIQATQPDIVMVELCKGRVNILQLDEKTILEEAKNMNFDKMRLAIRQSGFVQGVMYLLLLSMSAHLTKQLGMAPGGEFRRAFSEAKKVPGCLIHLGDRPIQITLQRALSALSWWQKLRLAWFMITCKEPISKEEVERCKQSDLLEELLAEMTGEFPALSQVFVKERDTYLTHSLQLAVSSVAGHQAKLGTSALPAVVVGVVGIGHVPGIVENWGRVSENDIPPLLKIPEPTLSGKLLRYSLRASALGLVMWGCYRVVPFQRISGLFTSIPLFQSLRHTAS